MAMSTAHDTASIHNSDKGYTVISVNAVMHHENIRIMLLKQASKQESQKVGK